MKTGIIIETNEPGKARNAFRFAVTAMTQGYEVKLFLMDEAVEGPVHPTYSLDEHFKNFIRVGSEALACDICLACGHPEHAASCHVSTMTDCVDPVPRADKYDTEGHITGWEELFVSDV